MIVARMLSMANADGEMWGWEDWPQCTVSQTDRQTALSCKPENRR